MLQLPSCASCPPSVADLQTQSFMSVSGQKIIHACVDKPCQGAQQCVKQASLHACIAVVTALLLETLGRVLMLCDVCR